MRPRGLSSLVCLVGLASAAPVGAQAPLDSLTARLSAMTAISGFERALADTLLSLLPGAARDRAGNVVLTLGAGTPKRLVACPMDEPGFVVGRVRPDGYLTLRRVGPSPGRLADQQYEGQRVTIFGRRGAVPGVVGVRSVHLTRGRGGTSDAPFTFDDAVVDVGAEGAGQVAALGIAELAPLTLEKRPQPYGDGLLAAPVAARRLGCAALIRAARLGAAPATGTTVVAFVVEQGFTRRGLATLAHLTGPFDRTLLLDGPRPDSAARTPPADPRLGAVATWVIPARYPGSPVETVRLADGRALEERLRGFIRGTE